MEPVHLNVDLIGEDTKEKMKIFMVNDSNTTIIGHIRLVIT